MKADSLRVSPAWVARQRAAASRLRREILRLDPSLAHPYLRDLRRHSRSIERAVPLAHVWEHSAQARVVAVGEFHAVAAHQAFAERMLRELRRRRGGVVLGVEFVYTRQQHWLERRQAGLLDDRGFLRRVHYAEEWGYPWEGYRRLLDAARELNVPVFGLDIGPRSGFRHLPRRDEHAARRIVSLLEAYPDSTVLVLFGESHLSPNHIPRRLLRQARRRGLASPAVVLVYQDPEAAYWAWLPTGEPLPEAVQLGPGRYAVFHTSPLGKYEAYRQVLERWREDVPGDEEVDLTPAVHHLIDALAGWLGLRPARVRLAGAGGWGEELADAYPEVYSGPEADAQLPEILREHGRSAGEIEEARWVLATRGALYERRSNVLFLHRYLPAAAAGEAARFLRTALSGRLWTEPEARWAAPRARILGAAYDEAVAVLGARLMDPTDPWPPVGEGTDRGQVRSWGRRLAGRHAEPPPSRREGRRWARALGRALGESWFAGVRRGELGAPELRRIFRRRLSERSVVRVWQEWLDRI